MHYTYIEEKRMSNHMMKDCRTFIRLQEAEGSKQAEVRNQGYAVTRGAAANNAPLQHPSMNGAAQGQGQQNQSNQNNGGYIPSKWHITE
jgi:hypothetical protein